MSTATTRRPRNQTCPVSIPHGDISQVWAPIDRPPVSAEAMSDDCRRRARFYTGSKFWQAAADTPCPAAPKKTQLRLLDVD